MFWIIKKYDIISGFIFIFVLFVTIKIVTGSYKAITVASLPIEGRIIVIDAGHGIPDGGAVGINGTVEQKINLKIAKKLQQLLEQSGAYVIMVRNDENSVSNLTESDIKEIKRDDMKKRKFIRDNSECDAFISIHMNKFQEEKYKGAQVFYDKRSHDSKLLGKSVQDSLKINVDQSNNRLAKSTEDIYILKNTNVPSIIVECGFLSNYEEEKLLNDEKYQDKITYGIYHGIINYFQNNKGTEK